MRRIIGMGYVLIALILLDSGCTKPPSTGPMTNAPPVPAPPPPPPEPKVNGFLEVDNSQRDPYECFIDHGPSQIIDPCTVFRTELLEGPHVVKLTFHGHPYDESTVQIEPERVTVYNVGALSSYILKTIEYSTGSMAAGPPKEENLSRPKTVTVDFGLCNQESSMIQVRVSSSKAYLGGTYQRTKLFKPFPQDPFVEQIEGMLLGPHSIYKNFYEREYWDLIKQLDAKLSSETQVAEILMKMINTSDDGTTVRLGIEALRRRNFEIPRAQLIAWLDSATGNTRNYGEGERLNYAANILQQDDPGWVKSNQSRYSEVIQKKFVGYEHVAGKPDASRSRGSTRRSADTTHGKVSMEGYEANTTITTSFVGLAASGDWERLDALIPTSANIDQKDDKGWTALLYASAAGQINTVGSLLDKFANPNFTASGGWSPLTLATAAGHKECVDLLLLKGAHVDQATDKGTTALIVAAGNGRKDLVESLIQSGADPSHRDQSGKTALDYAKEKKQDSVIPLLEHHP